MKPAMPVFKARGQVSRGMACVPALALGALLSAQTTSPVAPAPAGPVTGACHVSPIVTDLDRSARFYHDLIGLDLVPAPPAGSLPWDEDPGHLHLHGLPQSRLRFIGARMPGIRCGVELVEIDKVDRTAVRRRIQDTGAVTLILLVRDLDAVFAKMKAAGVPVISTGGTPLAMSDTSKTRAVIVQDPDGHFVELAQLDPLPATAAPASSNVIGIRLRVTVSDMDGTLAFYQQRMGLKGELRAFASSPRVSAMLGLPHSEYRLATIRMPNSPLQLEFMELKGLPGAAIRSRVQDPGSFRLQLNVRDIDATLAGMMASGSTVVSSNRVPVSMTFGSRPWRLAIAPDPNNLFLVVQQPPPPAVAPQSAAQAPTPAPAAPPVTAGPGAHQALVGKYCVSCHNARTRTADLALDGLDPANAPRDAAVWEKVIRKLRAGAMPPQGMPQPDAQARAALVSFLETSIDRQAAASPSPGRPALHRLNRVEYQNVIRDLLALDVDAASLLPADDSSFGFDNVADVLGVSPVLLERYIAAAEKISAMAVGDPGTPASDKTYRVRFDLTQTGHIDGLPLGTRGGTLIRETFPLDGEYVIKPKLWRTNVGFIRGLASPHQVEISVDGERVHLVTVGTPEDYQTSLMGPDNAVKIIEARMQTRVPIKAGPRAIGVTFVQKTGALPPTLLQPYLSTLDPVDSDGVPRFEAVTISGPYKPTGAGETPSRRRVFTCRPAAGATAAAETACATQIITTLARRAYRRPVNDADVAPLLAFYQTGRGKGGFDGGIQLAVQRILSDPEFVFRAERDPAGANASGAAGPRAASPRGPYRISDLELASRLSFFLWSSVPDDQLLTAAAQGRLKEPAVLERQVRRMLADPRAAALISNFAGQWLYLRNLRNVVPSKDQFPDFDDNLRQALQRETELLLEHVMRQDRSVLELLTADYTFVNERLARHYNIPNVYGTHFRRVPVPNDARRGLLGHGSILTVTSQPNRTSPVLRGKWILDNLLGTPPPAPPADVPPLKENAERERPLTMREQMEEHRANPACAGCHKLMDPLGFALENFDGVGAWRTSDSRAAIDPSTELADGTRVAGPAALRQTLVARPQVFVGTMTEKMLTYALGRGLEHYDMPAVRTIVRDAGGRDHRFSSLVVGIVNSVPFQMRSRAAQGSEAPPRTASMRAAPR
jgi:catechol 2,3-dioxygenase-like lactoylglutathione lyase family enzyme/mono/diheme cytochrome c family protein